MLSYLARSRQEKYNNIVYVGVASGIIASILAAIFFTKLAGGFSGKTEQIFEGTTMLVGAALLTTMILWMRNQKNVGEELQNKVAAEITGAHKFGLFSLVFLSVLREGIETVIFLGAASIVCDNNLSGAVAGIAAAVVLGYGIFVGSMKINLRKFFTLTGVLLILFAAGHPQVTADYKYSVGRN